MAANDVPCCETMFWVYLVICVALVCFAGLMSGLTLGLMSLSLVDLEVLIKAGKPEDKKNAEKILPIVKNQHLLLCTLLIWNALAMEALPIFVDALLPAWGAILISVTLILAFGEIIPQSVCSRYGLNIGARLSVVVRLLVIIVFPISYPISKLLDLLLGKGHSALLRRAELKTLVDMHGNEVKNLIKSRPEDGTPIRNLTIRRIPRVHECLPLYDILNQFQKGQSHMAVVVKNTTPLNDVIESSKSVTVNINVSPRAAQRRRTDRTINVDSLVSIPRTDERVLGIITMEDVLEELLQEQIYDETDDYVDLHNQIKINMIPRVKMPPSQSPGKAHSTTASPYSSRHQTAIMRSPLSPYNQSPIISSSAGNSSSASPAGTKSAHQGSPSTYSQVSRNSYEKLRKPDQS
ncbi:CBS domain protein with a domain protein [Perilla frutescens var. frutescens]|nr:CBS domain protein with a domain protein [Perilla frutescens var. frutescens]